MIVRVYQTTFRAFNVGFRERVRNASKDESRLLIEWLGIHSYNTVPTACHWNGLALLQRRSRLSRSEVRPLLHHSLVTLGIPECKGVVKCRWFREIQSAGCCVISAVGGEQFSDV
jgi:hypothetical protein